MITRNARGKTIELKPETHKRLKMLSALRGEPLSNLTDQIIREQLSKMPEIDRIKNQNSALFQVSPIR